MTKIYQGELPEVINVVIDGKVITKAVFIGGVYETDNKAVVKELKDYGYKVEDVVPAVVKETLTPEQSEEKPAKNKKKKAVD